jgi:C4-dicarboxylate-specific signal transduction histidine kinase
LNRFDLRTETFKHYSPNDGLPNNIIFGILDDPSGNLWLSTDKGISKFNPNTEIFQNFDQDDGLQNDHFFWGSSHKSKDGELFFGGIDGLNSFYPDSINKLLNVPMAVLLDLKVFNESVPSEKTFSSLNEIELKHNQNFLTFEFTGLDYIEPQKSQYLYKLDGIDNQWVNGGSRRFATYTNLSPGHYTFRLNVSNNEEVWSAQQLNFKVHIKPPWWKTGLAWSIFLMLILGFLWFIYSLRINILKRQKKNLEIEVINRTVEITEKNVMLELQTEEILNQKESLNKQRDELFIKNEELQNILSQLELTQKALIESEKMASLGILSAGIAHEINNPLNFISVSIYTIKEQLNEWNKELINCIDKQKVEDLKSLLSFSETGIERISSIINSLRAYSHKSGDKPAMASINPLLNNTMVLLHSKIKADIQIELQLTDIPEIPCKQDQLAQVFVNIVDNAIFALNELPEGTHKLLRIESTIVQVNSKSFIKISFANSGHPIEEEKIKHIFDPFYTTKSPNVGSGLGLYISYNIIKEHAGMLYAENTNAGVVFNVILPLSNEV